MHFQRVSNGPADHVAIRWRCWKKRTIDRVQEVHALFSTRGLSSALWGASLASRIQAVSAMQVEEWFHMVVLRM